MTDSIFSATAYKRQLFLYRGVFDLLLTRADTGGFISFKDARYLLGVKFHVRYGDAHTVFKELEYLGLAKVIAFRGLQLNIDSKQRGENFIRCVL